MYDPSLTSAAAFYILLCAAMIAFIYPELKEMEIELCEKSKSSPTAMKPPSRSDSEPAKPNPRPSSKRALSLSLSLPSSISHPGPNSDNENNSESGTKTKRLRLSPELVLQEECEKEREVMGEQERELVDKYKQVFKDMERESSVDKLFEGIYGAGSVKEAMRVVGGWQRVRYGV